jgi:hypothetical protein
MARKRTAPSVPTTSIVPHSWPLSNWPSAIYPNDKRAAKYLVRQHRLELLQAGALVRVGRELAVIGAPYVAWLAKKATCVPGYSVACNRVEQLA